jgi:hypothetical protein
MNKKGQRLSKFFLDFGGDVSAHLLFFFGGAMVFAVSTTRPDSWARWIGFVFGSASIIPFFFGIFYAVMRLWISIQNKNTASRISKAPGSKLLSLVEYLYSPKVLEGVFKPLVAEWRHEYFDALRDGKTIKASWINARYVLSFFMAMGLSKVLSFFRSVAHK